MTQSWASGHSAVAPPAQELKRIVRFAVSIVPLVALSLCSFTPDPLGPTRADAQTKTDYLIIVASNDLVAAVDDLKTWKEQIGYSVKVETVSQILASTPGADDAERVWNYLHDRYPVEQMALRYVLLVGDIDQIPIRMLYPDGNPLDGDAFGSDFYYANLDQANWDVDGDDRWGEFLQDHLDTIPEVAVGRIPVNEATPVQTICQNIVAFEQDIGAWKRSALFAHGIMDYEGNNVKSDQAVLAERLRSDFIEPLGGSAFTLYEWGGIDPSIYTSNDSLCQLNFENNCGLQSHGVLSCNGHGNTGGFGSFQWVADLDHDGEWDPDPPAPETVTNLFSGWVWVSTHPIAAIGMLSGCNTGAIIARDTLFEKSTLRSRYLIRIPTENTIAETYLREGAPAMIAATAGGDYSGAEWTSLQEGGWNTFSYLFFEGLLDQDRKAGDAYDQAQVEYARSIGLWRGIRDFNFFGDPSVSLKGVENRPGGPDVMVKEGAYHGYAADNDDNGDMFVGVVARGPLQAPGEVDVYKSMDHGATWNLWYVVTSGEPITSADVLVSRWQSAEQTDDRLHVFYTTPSGRVYDRRVQLADPSSAQLVLVGQVGTYAVQVTAARDPGPMPADLDIYVAWSYEISGTHYVMIASSSNDGSSWTTRHNVSDRVMPDVDAGPDGHVYLAMLTDAFVTDSDLMLARSVNHGVAWDPEENLTDEDGALQHFYPSVAASTDPAFPAVWVAYEYEQQTDQWGIGRDLRYAYSPDAGARWYKSRIMSAELGVDEWMPDLRGYRSAPNRWVNLAYNWDAIPNPGQRRNIIWRWTSGSLPRQWSPIRIVNDYPSSAPSALAPRVVFSPGAGPGGGVVYGGPNGSNLFFSAPWLAGPQPSSGALGAAAAPLAASRVSEGPPATDPGAELDGTPVLIPRHPASGSSSGEPFLVWAETEDLPGALFVASLGSLTGGGLLASGTARGGGGRCHGVVYASFDGSVWNRLPDPPESWSIACAIELEPDVLLAGGIAFDGSAWSGAIYRTVDFGDHWTRVLDFPDGVVSKIIKGEEGTLYAATGWNGQVFRSDDTGFSWNLQTDLGGGVLVRDIIWSPDIGFLVALDGGAAPSPIMKSPNGFGWDPAGGLAGVEAVYDILDRGDAQFAAVRDVTGGRVYQSHSLGDGWEPLGPFPDPDVVAARSVSLGPDGTVLAGIEHALGPSSTHVFALAGVEGPWVGYGGAIDLATAVYCMTTVGETVYAGTGFLYGNVYRYSHSPVVGLPQEVPGGPQVLFAKPGSPNPFGSQTTIEYYLPAPAAVTLSIYEASGRRVRKIMTHDSVPAGWHRVVWTGVDDGNQPLPAGVYFFRLAAGDQVRSGKLTLVR